MHLIRKHKLLIAGASLVAAASGGAAYAATQSSSNPRQAYLNDVAGRLHVTPAQLSAAMKAALFDRIDAAVKAGRLSQAQANRIKQRIERGDARFPGPPFGFHGFRPGPHQFPLGHRGPLSAAAQYLGLTDAQLVGQLQTGKSLAQVAQAKGKSVSGLEQAIITAVRARLDRLASAGWLTKAQEQRILNRLSKRIDRLVNRSGLPRLAGPPRQTDVPGPPPGGPAGPQPGSPAGPQPGGPAGPPPGGPAGPPPGPPPPGV